MRPPASEKPAASQRGLLCHIRNAVSLWNELRTEEPSQRVEQPPVHPLCGSWDVAVVGLHFKKQPILRSASLCECSLFSAIKLVIVTHQALGEKSRHLIFTGYAENIPVYRLNSLKSHNLLLSCNT